MTVGGQMALLGKARAGGLLSGAGLLVVGAALVPVVLGHQTTGQAVAAQGNGQSNDNCVMPSNNTGNCLSTFGVAVGSINPIYPAQSRTMPVTFSNPNSFDIAVTSFTVKVAVPRSSSCSPVHLTVPAGTQRPSPALAVPRKGTSTITIPVTLSKTVTDSCKGTPFAVTVDATGVKK